MNAIAADWRQAVDDGRPFSDDVLALRFADRYADDLRFVAAWGRWLAWDGNRWRFDETLDVFDRARRICREASAECSDPKLDASIASAKTVAAIERLAKSDRRLAATVDQWDAAPWLLATPGGVIDLRTGTRRPSRPEDYSTRTTAVAPGGACPTWLAFLTRVAGGDRDLVAYLKRACGYALTGSTQEHALFFLHGLGANGKSVFLNTVSWVLGAYQKTAPIETFTATTNDRHPTDLAGLRGARLVTSIETEEGRRWAEAKIKQLTGGDPVSARFMRQDFFEYVPQFKLFVAGNHKPGLRSVDEAIRRRFHLIPFSVTIPPEERDPDLGEKLKAEAGGILSWMVEGCRDWQRIGLAPPAAVVDATAAYLENEDAIAAWLDECTERHPQAWAASSSLYSSWREWADRTGEFAGTQKRFSQNLESRGIEPSRRTNGRGFQGLRLIATPTVARPWGAP